MTEVTPNTSPADQPAAPANAAEASDRLGALVCSIIADDPRARHAVANIISVACIMTKHLSPAQRAAIAWHLREQAEEIDATWQ
jgi:hypothetical protein